MHKTFIIACVKDWDRYVCLYGYGNILPSKHTFSEKSLLREPLRLILENKLSTEAYYRIPKFCSDVVVKTGEIVDRFKEKSELLDRDNIYATQARMFSLNFFYKYKQ